MKKLNRLYKSIKISPIYGNKRKWEVLEDLEYTFKSFGKPFTIYIKKGFIFDGASIPRVFWIFGTPMGTDTLPGALFHDFLYRKQILTRSDSDQCFNELMIYTNTFIIKRILFYLGVRIGGWIAWIQNKAKK